MQNLYGTQTILHSKSLCYSTPPERGHLSRTGHIGGYYMLVYTVLVSNSSGLSFTIAKYHCIDSKIKLITLPLPVDKSSEQPNGLLYECRSKALERTLS